MPFWHYVRLFRESMLSSHPGHLYRARMALFRTPFCPSVPINDTDLIRIVLRDRQEDFPKSMRLARGLRQLLGRSVFIVRRPRSSRPFAPISGRSRW
jgi:hypothetical protein